MDSKVKDLDLDLDLRGEDLDLDLDSDCEDLNDGGVLGSHQRHCVCTKCVARFVSDS